MSKLGAIYRAWIQAPSNSIGTEHDVLRAKSLFDFGKKQRKFSLHRQSDAPDVVSGNGHESSSSSSTVQPEAILEWLQKEMGYRPLGPYSSTSKSNGRPLIRFARFVGET
ncbi:hypothetical protein Q3G72_024164 [Acer saccharum]|nr:hypothetical protein Q3G72_024164 [Acer saccharum]